jgi:hypothetical protein
MTRSQDIAVRVPRDQMEAAAAHYKAVLGVTEKERSPDGIGLKGPDFNLWIDAADGAPCVLQEFVTQDRDAARAAHQAAGSRIYDESEHGFHVEDPYGMHYHVWVEKGG